MLFFLYHTTVMLFPEQRLITVQRVIEWPMLEILLSDHMWNKDIRWRKSSESIIKTNSDGLDIFHSFRNKKWTRAIAECCAHKWKRPLENASIKMGRWDQKINGTYFDTNDKKTNEIDIMLWVAELNQHLIVRSVKEDIHSKVPDETAKLSKSCDNCPFHKMFNI